MDFFFQPRYNFSMGLVVYPALKFLNGGDYMASTSDKLAKLESKISKRQKHIADEQDKLDKDLAEYDRLSLIALADKFKLSGKDLFSAIQREHEQLEKLRGEGMTDEDISSLTDNAPAESVADAPKYGSFPRSFTSEGALNE